MDKHTIKILSIDGGGIRGVVPAMLLHEIEKRVGKPAWQIFDFIAGTSIGAPIALMTSINEKDGTDYTAGEIVDFFNKYSYEIFHETFWYNLKSLWGLIGPKCRSIRFRKILAELMGDLKLSDAKTNVMVPVYEAETHSAVFFKSFRAKHDPSKDFYVRDVALATTAVPSILDIEKIKNVPKTKELVCLDGGLTAYQMGLFSVVEARRLWPEAKHIILISLGTGQPPMGLKYNKIKKWGILQWFQPLLKVVMWGSTSSVDYALGEILNIFKHHQLDKNYYRLQPEFEPRMSLVNFQDDANGDYRVKLTQITNKFIKNNDALIQEFCDKLKLDK